MARWSSVGRLSILVVLTKWVEGRVGKSAEGPGMIDLLTSFHDAKIAVLLECPQKRN